MKDYQLEGNKEKVALGAMNVVGSMTSCYVATGKEYMHVLKKVCDQTLTCCFRTILFPNISNPL